MVAPVTVSAVDARTPPVETALMVVEPAVTPLTTPEALMVATAGTEDDQTT
jgi:hypothetical protein